MRLLRSTGHAIPARLLPLLMLLVLGSAACSDLAPVTGDAGADTTDQTSEDASEPAADDASEDASEPAAGDAAEDEETTEAATVTPITAEQVELVCSDDDARAATAADVGVSGDIIAEVCSLLYPAQ